MENIGQSSKNHGLGSSLVWKTKLENVGKTIGISIISMGWGHHLKLMKVGEVVGFRWKIRDAKVWIGKVGENPARSP